MVASSRPTLIITAAFPAQLVEVAKVNRTVREYLAELEQENPVEPPVPQQDQVSTTDPDSTYATKGRPARPDY